MTSVRRVPRIAVVGVVVAAIAIVAAACTPKDEVPPGAAPLRYRDLAFSTITATKNVSYGSAVDQQGTRAWQTYQRGNGDVIYGGRQMGPAPRSRAFKR